MVMKGRKPKPDAQRRGGIQPGMLQAATVLDAEIVEPSRIRKPAHIAINPLQSQCWDDLVRTSPNFEQCDVPLLEAYCFWFAVLRHAETGTIMPDGEVVTVYELEGKNGDVKLSQNPDIRTAEKATAMLRLLGGELNLTPSARDRAGLMHAMTRSTQADMVKKTMDAYEQFKRQQKALNEAK
jgi:phage terminase small subunit